MTTTGRSVFLGLTFLALCHGQSGLVTVTGNGTSGFFGDNGPAISAVVSSPLGGLAADGSGNLYIADVGNDRVRKVNSAGNISTYAGTGKPGTAGDGGQAMSAQLYNALSTSWQVEGLAVDAAGDLYITDTVNKRVRKVTPDGVINIFAGGGNLTTDGILATKSILGNPTGVAVDGLGNVYIVDATRIRMVNAAGIMTTVAGNGTAGYSGDGGMATQAAMEPQSMAIDSGGNLYIADYAAGVIRKVDATSGIITPVAGVKTNGLPSSGDGGPANKAVLQNLHGVAVDKAGNIFVVDSPYLRKIDTSGTITTIGSQYGDYNGSPTPLKLLGGAQAVAVDPAGNLYVAEFGYVQELAAAPPAPPAITSVLNGASFLPGFAANSWVTIKGTNLAAQTDDWSHSIVNGELPTLLDGVSVTIGGKPAYIYYISAGQLNVLAPDIAAGPVMVTVTAPGGTSASFSSNAGVYSPAFFPWPNNQIVATRQDYSYAVKAGTFAGATTIAAKPGDVVVLWGTGFGPTAPAFPIGVEAPATGGYSTASLPTVTINNISAMVYGAALSPGSAGLYQIAIQVPSSLGDGDWPIQASIGGVASPAGTILTVQR